MQYTDEELIRAIRRTGGNLAAAARLLKCASSDVRARARGLDSRRLPKNKGVCRVPACEDKLWAAYKADPENDLLRNALVERHLPLVARIVTLAAVRLPPRVSRDDLISAGQEALIDKVETFDLARKIKFSSHAYPRIWGAVTDSLRRTDHIGRVHRARDGERSRAAEILSQRLAGKPTHEELAEALGWSLQQVCESHVPRVTNIGQPGTDGSIAEREAATRETRQLDTHFFGIATRGLEFDDRLVLYLVFFKNCTHKQVAAVLGLSESCISYMRSRALAWLKKMRDFNEVADAFNE